MSKAGTLNKKEQEFVENLRESLRQGTFRFDWLRLVHLTGVALQSFHSGKGREDKLVGALARGLSVREQMAAEEGGNISAEEAARWLKITKQSVLNLYHAGKLLGWRTQKQGAVRFPVWQFSENGRLPGFEEVLTKLNAGHLLDDWGKIGFFLQTHQLLGDRRPLDLLRASQLEPVLKAAQAYVE